MKVRLSAQGVDWCMAAWITMRSGFSVMCVGHGGT